MKREKRFLYRAKPWLGILLLCFMLWLLARQLTGMNWRDVKTNLTDIPFYVIACMLVGTAVSYTIYSYYDVRSVKTFRTKFSNALMFVPAFVAYAANFNFGGIIGAVGMRVKLYTDLGLKAGQIGGIVALSTVGNWLGYLLFGGLLLSLRPPTFSVHEQLISIPWREVGIGMLALLLVIFAVLYKVGPHEFKRLRIQVPGVHEAAVRCALAFVNWLAVSGILLCVFSWHFNAPIEVVCAAYIVSAVAGALVHVPGGVGVFETVFLAGLRGYLPVEEVMASLLTFRALYYVVPLIVAMPCWLWFHFQISSGNTPHFRKTVEETA